MKNLIIGIIIGIMIGAPIAWAAAAHRIMDTDGNKLSVGSDGYLTIKFQ
ncbi:MAG: hypothetical protein KKE05_04310 [Nanoarchaeota archaeon]|nr:hypothetical protein [Nanoarchaeota archaeon]